MRVAILSTYPPRRCGLATFTTDLRNAVLGADSSTEVLVAAVVDAGGISVRTNIINVEPDDEHVKLGMEVRLATYSLGTDDDGVEAIGFGYEHKA